MAWTKNGRHRWKSIKRMSRQPLADLMEQLQARTDRQRKMEAGGDCPECLLAEFRRMTHDCRAALSLREPVICETLAPEWNDPDSYLNRFAMAHMAARGAPMRPEELPLVRNAAMQGLRMHMESNGYAMPHTSICIGLYVHMLEKRAALA